jgi:4'-phosphopantetheinyl transferase
MSNNVKFERCPHFFLFQGFSESLMIEIWDVSLDTPQPFGFDWLPVDDQQRVLRMGTPLLKSRMASTRMALRTILGLKLGMDPAKVPLEATPLGRPFLSKDCEFGPLWFNLTHASGRMLAAVSRDMEVGIDLERSDRRVEPDKLAPAVMNEIDLFWFQQQCEPLRAFLRLWTAKESVLKLLGTGLQINATAVSLDWQTGSAKIHEQSTHFPGRTSHFRQVLEEPEWVAHLATDQPVTCTIQWCPFHWNVVQR